MREREIFLKLEGRRKRREGNEEEGNWECAATTRRAKTVAIVSYTPLENPRTGPGAFSLPAPSMFLPL